MTELEGFFDKSHFKTRKQQKQPEESNTSKHTLIYDCNHCGLFKGKLNPYIKPYGNFNKQIICVGEAPGKYEDKTGRPWQGPVGNLLQRTMQESGISLFSDCININSVACFPTKPNGNTGTPTPYQIKCCSKVKVEPFLEQYKGKAKVILLFGGKALSSVIGSRYNGKGMEISRWRGMKIPEHDLHAWVCPLYHPSYIVRGNNNEEVLNIWKRDIKEAVSMVNIPLPEKINTESNIQLLLNPEVGDIRNFVDNNNLICIDFETTGIKPHKQGHKILCISITVKDSEYRTLCFIPNERVTCELADILLNPHISKIAHNLKFENMWANECLGLKEGIKGWIWDTIIGAHVLDNRNGIKSLKLQGYVNFGLKGYEGKVSQYIKSTNSKNSNSPNRLNSYMYESVDNNTKMEVLKYCAVDTILTYKLAEKQVEEIKRKKLIPAYKLLHKGIIALSDCENRGIRINVEYCNNKNNELEKQISNVEQLVLDSKLGRIWKNEYSSKTNIYSSQQLERILYTSIGIDKGTNVTSTGRGMTDEPTLVELKDKVGGLNQLLELRKLNKIKNTYLSPFIREQINGIIHPFFNLHTVKTYRSSSERPNFQNIPNRSQYADMCRSAIYPRPGHQLLEADYTGIEVRIACCITGDKKLTEDTIAGDMHSDMAIELYLLDKEKFNKNKSGYKELRFGAKSGFVFPQFYGDYYVNNVKHLLKYAKGVRLQDSGVTVYEHLRNKGLVKLSTYNNEVLDYSRFERHVKNVEHRFWNERYKQYNEWKKRTWNNYRKNGYLTYPLGFKTNDLLTKNEALNSSIQGSAFHCLLYSLIEVNKWLKTYKYDTRVIGQIHDSIIMDVNPEELETVAVITKDIMVNKVPKIFSWVNVPLEVEMELYDIDGSWTDGKLYEVGSE